MADDAPDDSVRSYWNDVQTPLNQPFGAARHNLDSRPSSPALTPSPQRKPHGGLPRVKDANVEERFALLARCVGDVDAFLSNTWPNSPFIRPNADIAYFADLVTLDDIDYLVSATALRYPAVRLVREGSVIPEVAFLRTGRVGPATVDDLIHPGKVWRLFHDGATLILPGMQRYWAPLMRFTRELELELSHGVQANTYITPPRSRALDIHYDTHDVFVLQFAGRKRWQVFHRLAEFPLSTQRSPALKSAGPPALEAELAPGDCLYIPRGVLHRAESLDETSGHIALGLLARTWRDVIGRVVAQLDQDVAFREPLPLGFAREPGIGISVLRSRVRMLMDMLEETDVDELLREEALEFVASREPILVGQFGQLQNLDAIGDETLVRRRRGIAYALERDGNEHAARLILGDRWLSLAEELHDTVDWILSVNSFQPRELVELAPEARIDLVRRLVVEGVLEFGAGLAADRPTTVQRPTQGLPLSRFI